MKRKNPLTQLLLILGCTRFWVLPLSAQPPSPVLIYSDSAQRIETSPFAAVLEDPKAEYTIEQVMAMPDSSFLWNKKSRLNLGNSAARYWVRIYVENKTGEDLYFLNFVATINRLDLYAVSTDGHLTAFPPGGTMRPLENRSLKLPKTNYNLGKNPGTLFVAIQSNQSLTFTNFIGTKDVIYGFIRVDERVSFFMLGLCFILAIYNLLIFLYNRDWPYLWYAVYEFGAIWYCLYISGYGYEFFWRSFPGINADANFCMVPSVVGACLFSMTFLNTQNFIPRFHTYLKILLVVFIGSVLLQPLGFGQLANDLVQLTLVILYFSLCIAGWLMLFKKQKTARFYVVGWTIYLIIIMLYVLAEMGFSEGLHDFIFNNHLLNMSVMQEGCFLALALADRVREIRQQTQDAQQLLLKQSSAYDELVQKHNQLLEATPTAASQDAADAAKQLETLMQSLRSERDTIRKVSIPTMEGVILLPMSDLVRIEAMGSYSVFHLSAGKRITASRPIGDFEAALPEPLFFRVHKSHIVNLNSVERYIRGEGGSVLLQDGAEVPVSRTAKGELMRRLNIS